MSTSTRLRAAALVAFFCLVPAAAHAQATIKVNDSISVRVGFLSQMWIDFNQNVRQDSSFAQSIFLRRIRFLVGGQVGSHLNFFFETDAPNLGRTTAGVAKSLGNKMIIQDAYVEVKPGTSNAFLLVAGLQLIPLCRNCLESAVTLLPIDYSSYSFLQGGPALTNTSVGRDVGLQAKGYLYSNKVEYRAGIFSGARLANGAGVVTSSNSLRGAGRIQVQLLEAEAPTYSYAGTYLGKRKILALGGGIDAQSSYKAWAADAFLSYPFGNNGITAQANFIRYDGDAFFPSTATVAGLPKQNTFEVEAGYHLTDAKITPFAKFEMRNVDDAFNTNAANLDEHRFQLGGTYYWVGHNLNVKAAYTRGTLDRLAVAGVVPPAFNQNGFTVQLQGFYY
jgi:hypothetical protein